MVLLIDDEADIREVVSISLTDAGYRVATAADGRTGLLRVQSEPPQIVITDIRMPGMDGIQVLDAVKKLNPDIEVIVITAFADLSLAVKALQLDASDFITKPISDSALHLALNRAKTRYTVRKQLKDYTRLLEKEKEDQARILHQDKMMSLGRLAASVVHEINNPLSGILNYIRLMHRILRSGPLGAERQEKFQGYLDLVDKELSRCTQIVSNLLTFSRKSPPAFETVHIDELLERCILLSRHRLQLQKIDLATDIQPDLPPVTGDANQLQQCVINLIFNAVDAMPAGGTLTLAAGIDRGKNRLTIAVSDTGCGIEEKNLPHIFEPFFTTKQEGYGVGLGLSTVYGIMQRHQGAVTVDSRPAKGTTFRLEIPLER